MSDITPERQRVLDYLLTHGLVARNIKTSSLNEDGFEAYNPITGALSRRMPWPEGLDYDWLQRLILVADRADFSRLSRSQYKRWQAMRETV